MGSSKSLSPNSRLLGKAVCSVPELVTGWSPQGRHYPNWVSVLLTWVRWPGSCVSVALAPSFSKTDHIWFKLKVFQAEGWSLSQRRLYVALPETATLAALCFTFSPHPLCASHSALPTPTASAVYNTLPFSSGESHFPVSFSWYLDLNLFSLWPQSTRGFLSMKAEKKIALKIIKKNGPILCLSFTPVNFGMIQDLL